MGVFDLALLCPPFVLQVGGGGSTTSTAPPRTMVIVDMSLTLSLVELDDDSPGCVVIEELAEPAAVGVVETV